MKNARFLLAASPIIIALWSASSVAHAAGVTAGTMIQNTASATYKSGTADGSVTSNTVDIRVDEVLNVAVADLTGSSVTVAAGSAILTYSVTNTGNGNEAFKLAANPNVTGNDFTVTVDQVVYDANSNGVYDAEDTIIPTGGAMPSLAPDAKAQILVYVTVPSGVADGSTSNVALLAEALTGTGTPGDAFAGKGDGGGDAVVGLSGADDSANALITSALSSVTLVKSAVVTDIWGGSTAVPGSTIKYTITATAGGTGTATNVHVTDIIPSGTSYVEKSLKLGSASLSDEVDSDAGTGGDSGIDVGLGDLASGNVKSVEFSVTID